MKEDLGGSGISGSKEQERGSGARRRKAMKASVSRASLLADGQSPRQRGEAETPTSSRSPRVERGRRLLGPAALRTCPLALRQSQVRARLGPGGYCRRPGNGGPQTCLPADHSVAKPAGRTTHLHQQGIQDSREGPSLVRRTTQDLLRSGLVRQAHGERRYEGGANLTRLS